MKYAYILLFLYVLPLCLNAQVPVIDWTSYYAGQLTTFDKVIYEPKCDCIYAAGYTADSTEVATVGSHKPSLGTLTPPPVPIAIELWKTDYFIAKFDLSGNRLWSTYFGGVEKEAYIDLAVDTSGNIYISGLTKSNSGITTPGSLYSTKPTENHVPFLAKFNPDGEQLWGTYYDVNNSDSTLGTSITTDSDNNVYLSRGTRSTTGISTPGSYQEVHGGVTDAYVVKFDSMGNRLWASYYGGEAADWALSKLGRDGYLYLYGHTRSTTGIATPGTFKTSITTGDTVACFLMKLNPVTGAKIWGTYMDFMRFGNIDIDHLGNVYTYTVSYFERDYTTLGTHQPVKPGNDDLIIMKFDNTGNRVWGTYYGGSETDNIIATYAFAALPITSNIQLSADASSFYICGVTMSTDGIATDCAYEPITANRRGFLAKFDTTGNILYGSYYDAEIHHIALSEDRNGSSEIYFVGRTTINGLATPGSHKSSKSTTLSGLIGKFSEQCPTKDIAIEHIGSQLVAEPDDMAYTWYHNGTVVSSGTENTYNVGTDTTGYYYAIAQYCECTYYSDTFWFDPIGIHDIEFSKNVNIYPNPSSEYLIIESQSSSINLSNFDMDIYNILGQVQSMKWLSKDAKQIKLSIVHLPAGVYYLKLKNGLDDHSLKFVKQ